MTTAESSRQEATSDSPASNLRVRYEEPAPRVARITLARPEAANAQDYRMLSELNSAFDRAARDPEISVIILAADGHIFSSGHDLGDLEPDLSAIAVVGNDANFHAEGAAGYMDREREFYLGYCRRWREIPKPTIAQVQGRVIAGGLLLVWAARPHRVLERGVVLRPRARHGRERCRVLHAPLRGGRAHCEGHALHREGHVGR